jgi:hypothetical protein
VLILVWMGKAELGQRIDERAQRGCRWGATLLFSRTLTLSLSSPHPVVALAYIYIYIGAKPKGKEIRDYVTQRFSSNMVFLSLLLGTDMGIFMNSSAFTTEIREALMNEEYTSLKFYIGGVLALASCTTVMGVRVCRWTMRLYAECLIVSRVCKWAHPALFCSSAVTTL